MQSYKTVAELHGQCEDSEGELFDFSVTVSYNIEHDKGDLYQPPYTEVEFDSYISPIRVETDDDEIEYSDLEFDKKYQIVSWNPIKKEFEKIRCLLEWILDMRDSVEYDYSYGTYSDSEEYYRDDEF